MDGLAGTIDKGELKRGMTAMARNGRIKKPSDAEIDRMMEQADEDGDGDIDFEEFVQLITGSDLHPSTCARCISSPTSASTGAIESHVSVGFQLWATFRARFRRTDGPLECGSVVGACRDIGRRNTLHIGRR